ncbi:nitroreductase family deazaflavin-dependent oxidoreductase [Mycolicibacterium moriokaense]|nr:nitroreductase family deazaflavin-dependent oxidoreductase [Mycolicibacterium moriokaense]
MTSHVTSSAKDAVRTFNKYVLNPAMLLLAGRRWWYAGVIRHTGRRTGKSYATPVVVTPVTGDGFVIPLPYGTEVDWLRNVAAAGRATVTVDGETYEVREPEVITAAEAAPLLPARRKREFARFGIGHYVRVQRVDQL